MRIFFSLSRPTSSKTEYNSFRCSFHITRRSKTGISAISQVHKYILVRINTVLATVFDKTAPAGDHQRSARRRTQEPQRASFRGKKAEARTTRRDEQHRQQRRRRRNLVHFPAPGHVAAAGTTAATTPFFYLGRGRRRRSRGLKHCRVDDDVGVERGRKTQLPRRRRGRGGRRGGGRKTRARSNRARRIRRAPPPSCSVPATTPRRTSRRIIAPRGPPAPAPTPTNSQHPRAKER